MKWQAIPLALVGCAAFTVSAAAKTDRFVWTNSPAPAAPYTNWHTAARTIQAAVDICGKGDTVVVTDGVYAVGGRAAPGMALTNRVMVTGLVAVVSVNGPKWTTIRGAGVLGPSAVRGAYLTNGAVLSGFRIERGGTLDGGATSDHYGGGVMALADCTVTNCQIVSNQAAIQGGGILAIEAVVDDCTVDDNLANEGGGAYLYGGVLRGSRFRGNFAGGDAGGAYVRYGDTADCTFLRNNGGRGGGLFLAGGTAAGIVAASNLAYHGGGLAAGEAVVSNAYLHHNSVLHEGGGAYLGQCWMMDSVVSNNNLAWGGPGVPAVGAGLACLGGELLERCDVRDNWGFEADDQGGGIACLSYGPWTTRVVNCSIRGNSAGNGGGIFVATSSYCTVSATGTNGAAIVDNWATNFGGGVFISNQAMFQAYGNVQISTNRALYGGGFAASSGGHALLAESEGRAPVLYGNIAYDVGGGFHVDGTNATLGLRNVRIGRADGAGGGNAALGNGGGGGLLARGAFLEGIDLRVEGNAAAFGVGGGLVLFEALMILDSTPPPKPATAQPRTLFSRNSALPRGGAIEAYRSQLLVKNAAFFDNQAGNGGAVYLRTANTAHFDNVVFAGNLATNGGGIRVSPDSGADTRLHLRHCTVHGNATGGVIAVAGGSDLYVLNSIVYGNVGTQVSAAFDVAASDVQGGFLGAGNVDAEPYFRNPALRDYHLTVDSTASVVNAATDAGFTNDCVFRARPVGIGFDMGAFEYRPDYDDTDGDDIPDGWELARGLDPRNSAEPAGDADPRSNYEEFLADTDPLDGDDFFRLNDCYYNPARPDRGVLVGFPSSAIRLYSLYSTAALSNDCTWAAVPGQILRLGAGTVYDGLSDTNAPADAGAKTYRVVVGPIPE